MSSSMSSNTHIFSLCIFRNPLDDAQVKINGKPVLLTYIEDLSPLPLYMRITNNISETLLFLSRTLISKTNLGQRHGCTENEYTAWAYCRRDGLCGVAITSNNYSKRIIFNFIDKAQKIYESSQHNWSWSLQTEEQKNNIYTQDALAKLLQDYHNPKQVDSLERCQTDLENTNVVLHKSIDLLLSRGEKIETLAAKSADLSAASKTFLRKAKKHNSWCKECAIM